MVHLLVTSALVAISTLSQVVGEKEGTNLGIPAVDFTRH